MAPHDSGGDIKFRKASLRTKRAAKLVPRIFRVGFKVVQVI